MRRLTKLEERLTEIIRKGKRPPLRQTTMIHQNRLAHYRRLYPDSPASFIEGYVAFTEGYALTDQPRDGSADWVRGWARAAADSLREAA